MGEILGRINFHLMVLVALLAMSQSSVGQVLVPSFEGFVEHRSSVVAFRGPLEQEVQSEGTRDADTGVRAPPVPRAHVLTTIRAIAAIYEDSLVLERVELTPDQWGNLFRANIEIESAYQPDAESHVGAYGLGQLMPETAVDLGVDRYNMVENLDGSARYLLQMLNRFESVEFALAAYNAGPNAVETHGGIPPFPETQNHVQRVIAAYDRLETE